MPTAEDLAQEVFLRLYNLDWTQIHHPDAWLTKCSFYAACNYNLFR
nr:MULTISPECIES: sigma factor [unclassified Dehalobacter]